MLRCYTVHEILSSGAPAGSEIKLTAASPEEAARLALGETLVRGGHSRRLRAKGRKHAASTGCIALGRGKIVMDERRKRIARRMIDHPPPLAP